MPDYVVANPGASVRERALAALPDNLRFLGLRPSGDYSGERPFAADALPVAPSSTSESGGADEDLEQIEAFTRIKFVEAFRALETVTGPSPGGILPFVRNVVNEASPRTALSPPGFRGALYPPQAAVVRRMLELEGGIFIDLGKRYRYNVGFLSERCAFGKTFLLAALAVHPVPEFPEVPIFSHPPPQAQLNSAGEDGFASAPGRAAPSGSERGGTVVVCSARVCAELADTFARFTDLDCARVASAAALDAAAAGATRAAVWIVKDGRTTWRGETRPTVEHFAAAVGAREFDRVVFDDYDLLKVPGGAAIPRARFYWLSSATSGSGGRGDVGAAVPPPGLYSSLLAWLKLSFLFSQVSCSADFSALEFQIPRPEFWAAEGGPREVAAALARGETPTRAACFPAAVAASLFAAGPVVSPAASRRKVLVCAAPRETPGESRRARERAAAALAEEGVAALALTKANVGRFAREGAAVGFAGLLHGVNMGYLTDIVIEDGAFSDEEVAQIVGRGQRLGRKASLQVYFAAERSDVNDILGCGQRPQVARSGSAPNGAPAQGEMQ